MQTALDRASKGRTTIVVAHRLTTIQKADNIVVLCKGQIVQQGTHAGLMADAGGVYHRLASAQSFGALQNDDRSINMESPTLFTTEVEEEFPEEMTKPRRSEEKSYTESEDEDDDEEANLIDGREKGAREFDGPSSHKYKLWMIVSEQTVHWKMYMVILFGAVGASAATPFQAYLFAVLLSLFSFWGTFLPSLVNFWVLMMAALAIGVGLGHAALGWSTTKLGFAITRTYRKEYFANMLHKPASFFDDDQKHSTGALSSLLSADPTQLQQLVGINMVSLITSSLSLVGCVAIALAFGWKLTLVTLSTTLPIIMAAMMYRMRYEMDIDRMSNAVFTESATFACENVAAIRTVVSLTLEENICAKYDQLLFGHVKDAFQKARVSVLLFALSDSVPLLCMAFVLWYGGQLLADHEYSPFQYMVIYIAVLQGGMSAGQWLSLGPNISSAVAAIDRMICMRQDDKDDICDASIDDAPKDAEKYGVELEFNNVGFRYPTRNAPVLKCLNLRVQKGQCAAIVGPSGSGKSTIVALIERFYAPQKGQIFQNGVDIVRMNLESYRRGISLVAQEPSLFSGSIRDNIALGVHDDARRCDASATYTVSEVQIHQAAQDAGIHDFIVSLPEGYDTAIGTAGLALSGGQKQRISLARALVRQPHLLLLDEATSSLDSETEAQVQIALEAMRGTRTMVIVAHRLATVQTADIIFVLGEGGVLAEQGNHASLIAQKGVYYNMVGLRVEASHSFVTSKPGTHSRGSICGLASLAFPSALSRTDVDLQNSASCRQWTAYER